MLFLLYTSKVNLFLDCSNGLLLETLVLEHCKFFKGASAGLGVEEVDNNELEENPSTVDGQVAPLDGIEGDRVDVGREEPCELAEDLLDTDAAASHRVGPKFDERSNTSSVVLGALGHSLDSLERDSDTNESAQHQSSRKHVHVTTLEAGHDKSNDRGGQQAPAGVCEVDAGLDGSLFVSHHVKEHTRVVAQKGVSRKLGEETDEDCDQETAAHTSGAQEIKPRLLGGIHLGLDGFSNLDDFGLDELGVDVTLGVVLDENRCGFFVSVLGDEETGRLREEAGGDLKQRGNNLQQRRESPRPVTLGISGTDGNGRGQNLADEVGRVEQRGQNSSLLGVSKLSDEG
ncbi:hypothetical protein HG530_014320 [Fusarium avenaceum]|nr:hypothetical protein HG530_014320 [Fusarium avenaceum]